MEIVTDIQDYFNYDRTDVSVYDRYKAGLFYMFKDGLSGEDWDFISNGTNTTDDEN
ncbi:hypothetical protein [Flavobacterium hibernum]|uniref:hypothetical protein n=1 Tax=Flavobacterium hibernum TaxID=37752 RepID=UPI000AE102E2|nr:hypothetical protein [Flavobacterium hibernum]